MLFLSSPNGIRPDAREAIRTAGVAGKLFISPYSAWEIGMLVSKGRLTLGMRPEAWFDAFLRRPQVTLAALTPAILIAASFLPGGGQGDPADKIIAATAREFGLTLVTRDHALLRYAQQGHIHALAC